MSKDNSLLYLIFNICLMFDVQAPVSPMLKFIKLDDDWNAVFFKMSYDEECDEFVVDEVVKYDVDTWEKVED